MRSLSVSDQLNISVGEDIAWGDYLSGTVFALGLGCRYTLNPYICGAALVGQGVLLFVDFE